MWKSKCRKSLIKNLFHQFSYIRFLKSIFIERKWGQKCCRKYIEIRKKLNENERISFVHSSEFRSTKISMETLIENMNKNLYFVNSEVHYGFRTWLDMIYRYSFTASQILMLVFWKSFLVFKSMTMWWNVYTRQRESTDYRVTDIT